MMIIIYNNRGGGGGDSNLELYRIKTMILNIEIARAQV